MPLAVIPPPPDPPALRLAQPLPPYRYVPGLNPHPLRHPEGHSRTPEPLDIERFWLRGLDLYDRRYYWEAHEVWEAAWRAVPAGDRRQLLQGLIQLAAATLKRHVGHERAAGRLLSRGTGRLQGVIASRGPVWHDIDLPATLASAAAFVRGEGGWPVIVAGYSRT